MFGLYCLIPVILLSVPPIPSPRATRYISLQVSNDAMSFYRAGVEHEAYVQGLRLHGDYGWNSREREWFEARINLAISYSIIGNRLGVLGIFSPEIRNGPHPGHDLLAHLKSSSAEVHLYLAIGNDSVGSYFAESGATTQVAKYAVLRLP